MTTAVRVGYCRNMPPYQYEDADGMPTGFHVELLEEVAKDTDLLLSYQAYESTSEAMEALGEGEIDVVLGVIEDQFTPYHLQYSRVISSANICLLAPRSAARAYRDGRRTLRLAVEYQIVNYSYVASITYSDVLLTSNQQETLEVQQRGQADLVVGIKDSLLWYLEKEGQTENYEILINYVNSADFTIGIRGGDRYLKEELDKGIMQVRTDGTYGKIYDSWFQVDDGSRYRRILRYVGIGAGLLAVALFTYYLISRRAKRKLEAMVAARTAELNLANQKLEQKNREIQAESELRQSIIESSPTSTFVFDGDFHIRYLNQNARELILTEGCENSDNVLEIPVLAAILNDIGPDLFEEAWTSKSGTMEKRNAIGDMEKKYRYSCHKIDRGGADPEALLSVEDVTVEDREREALFEKRKNATLNQLIVGIAHEIKNPLTAINTSVEMIQTKGNNEKYWKAFSTYIPAEVERITKLINSLVGYARPAEGKNEPVNLAELLQSAYELASVSAKGIRVERNRSEEEDVYVRCDRDRIKQCLMNVIFNGIESGQKQAALDRQKHHVRIGLTVETATADVEIEDDGVGMTAEEMKRCTEPFYTTKPTGTGIGLAVTKQYLDEIGGSLIVESEKHRFTRVTIRLPLMKKEATHETGNPDR
ncbi:MAG: transporter substrate-binding domain-containing protein [Clostridia bacterium]|nr:transporter substrate-binding domain-containing protein [Clostridia bacterium]